MHNGYEINNGSFKMLILDLDGTVLDNQKNIPEKNLKAIQKLGETGVIVAICSGRIYSGARTYAKELGLKGPLIACNGALIKIIEDNSLIYSNPLNIEDAIRTAEHCKSKDTYIHAYIDEVLVTEQLKFTSLSYSERNKTLAEEYRLNIKITENIVDFIKNYSNRIDKIVAISENSTLLNQLREEISKSQNVEIASSSFDNIEIMNRGVSKGKAIEFLCNYMNIDISQVIAIGDNENDIEMLKTVGFPIAMGNASDEVKSISKFITDTNENTGVAKAIEKFFLTSNF